MNDPVKIAIAGGGYGSKVALPVYSGLEEFEPVAIWSHRAERAQQLAADAGLELGTSDFDELLSTPGLEAVHVATPVVTHPEFALEAAERGFHVLCEKPVADNLEDARRIAAGIHSAGVVGAVDWARRMRASGRRRMECADEVVENPGMGRVLVV